jgi:hypothetical protein
LKFLDSVFYYLPLFLFTLYRHPDRDTTRHEESDINASSEFNESSLIPSPNSLLSVKSAPDQLTKIKKTTTTTTTNASGGDNNSDSTITFPSAKLVQSAPIFPQHKLISTESGDVCLF